MFAGSLVHVRRFCTLTIRAAASWEPLVISGTADGVIIEAEEDGGIEEDRQPAAADDQQRRHAMQLTRCITLMTPAHGLVVSSPNRSTHCLAVS